MRDKVLAKFEELNKPSDAVLPEGWTSSWITMRDQNEWPFTTISLVWHKKNLSNVAEPYLTAIKEARSLG